jgi:hypothetical protein
MVVVLYPQVEATEAEHTTEAQEGQEEEVLLETDTMQAHQGITALMEAMDTVVHKAVQVLQGGLLVVDLTP